MKAISEGAGRRIRPLEPKATVYYAWATTRQRRGDLVGAAAYYSVALDLEPAAEYFHARAGVRQQMGDLEGAEADLTETIKLQPQAGHLHQRGLVRLIRDDVQGALRDFTAALRQGRDPHFYRARALARERLGETDGAGRDLRRARDMFFRQGIRHMQRQENRQADQAFGWAIAMDPRHHAGFYARAAVRRRMADLSGAEADLSRAIEAARPEYVAHYYKARALVRTALGDHQGAGRDRLWADNIEGVSQRAAARTRGAEAARASMGGGALSGTPGARPLHHRTRPCEARRRAG